LARFCNDGNSWSFLCFWIDYWGKEMTDRELLKQAAKAADIFALPMYGEETGELYTADMKPWNPLTDDGECARMEAEAEIELEWFPIGVKATHYFTSKFVKFEDHNNDKNAARRYASTLVAAEIGNGIK